MPDGSEIIAPSASARDGITPPADAHNAAYDSPLTRGPAQFFERLAQPLNTYIYGPLTEQNRMLGMVVANLTLTTPRVLEPVLGQRYISHLQAGRTWRAFGCLAGKTLLKFSDGLDGPVTRENGITSLFGAGHDAFVDMVGTRDDGVRIKQAHKHLGIDDPATDAIIDARLALDIVTVVTGGIANTVAAKYAESKGATVPDHDQPKANAPAKAKFALSAVADAVLLAGTLPKKPETQLAFKRAGRAILIGSVAAGAWSNIKYVRSAHRNLRRAQAAAVPSPESEETPAA